MIRPHEWGIEQALGRPVDIAINLPDRLAGEAVTEARLRIQPITHRAANAFVRRLHRHSRPTVGAVIAVAVADAADQIRGVAIAGRPVAPALQDGLTMEILRVCTDGSRNACSMLYGACRRAARALGYQRILTYTLPTEGGASLRASGSGGSMRERLGRWPSRASSRL